MLVTQALETAERVLAARRFQYHGLTTYQAVRHNLRRNKAAYQTAHAQSRELAPQPRVNRSNSLRALMIFSSTRLYTHGNRRQTRCASPATTTAAAAAAAAAAVRDQRSRRRLRIGSGV